MVVNCRVYTLVVCFMPMIIMLLSHSLGAMRYVLKICDNFADEYDVKFNTNKSVATRMRNRYNKMCEQSVLSSWFIVCHRSSIINCYRYAYCISRTLYKIFGVSENESMLHMRHCLGLPSLINMIEIYG